MDEHGVAERVARTLESAGSRVIRIAAGDGFTKVSEREYAIRMDRASDYAELISRIEPGPANIAHFFSISRDRLPLADTKIRSFYSLLYLAQALGERAVAGPVKLLVISNGGHAVSPDETCWPEKALAIGPCRVMPEEYPDIRCQSIDLPAQWTDREIEATTAELGRDGLHDLVALRHGEAWVRAYEPVRLAEANEATAHVEFRLGGVYVITGGTGGIGLEIAGFLAGKYKAKVALISRSGSADAPAPATDEGTQGEVIRLRADVADAEQMEMALREVEDRFGKIDGLIHAAGIGGQGLIQMKTAELAEPVLRAKVDAIRVFEEALRTRTPDFLLLCSSLSSVLGGAGHVDYAAANATLDAFAQSRRGRRTTFVGAINWNTWKGIGMAANVQMPEALAEWKASVHGTGISSAEGVEALRRILASGLPEVAVSTLDLPQLIAEHGSFTPPSPAPQGQDQAVQRSHVRPNLGVEYVAPRNETEARIAGLWSELLGVEETGAHDNFFALGGHSLIGVRMLARLQVMFDVNIPLRRLFTSPTPAGLAEAVTETLDAREQKEAAELLAMIEQLGDEEAETELRKQTAAGWVN
jgi:acyl carrier protein